MSAAAKTCAKPVGFLLPCPCCAEPKASVCVNLASLDDDGAERRVARRCPQPRDGDHSAPRAASSAARAASRRALIACTSPAPASAVM